MTTYWPTREQALATIAAGGGVYYAGDGRWATWLDPYDLGPIDYPAPPAVPQLAGRPLYVEGHSWAALGGGWFTPGSHWSEIIRDVSGAGTLTNSAVAGSFMEDVANRIAGAAAGRWIPTATKTVAIIDGVINSALVHPGGDPAVSAASCADAATAAMVTVLCDVHQEYGGGWVRTGTWTPSATPYGSPSIGVPTGVIALSVTPGDYVEWTVPAGLVGRECWLATTGVAEGIGCQVRITVNGTLRYAGLFAPTSDTAAFTKSMRHIGKVTTGDVVRILYVAGTVCAVDGAYTDSIKHHVVMIGDVENIPSTHFPPFAAGAASILQHNAAVRDAVDAINRILPFSASYLDLSRDRLWTGLPLLYSGDTVHPNDRGMAWLAWQMSQQLVRLLPTAGRL